MDHNVDSTQQCVIASVAKETRLPDVSSRWKHRIIDEDSFFFQIRFKTLIRDTFSEEPRKSILKREAHSFEDYRQGGLLSVHRGILNRKAKSFEERDEEYDKVRRRIFRNREMFGGYESVDEQEWQWIQQERNENGGEKLKVPNRLVKVHASVNRKCEPASKVFNKLSLYLVNGWTLWRTKSVGFKVPQLRWLRRAKQHIDER